MKMNQAQLETQLIGRIIAFEKGLTDNYEILKDELREIIKEHFKKKQEDER